MNQKIDYKQIAPDADASLLSLEQYIHQSHLDPMLVKLVKYRVAQINGCPACLDKYSNLLIKEGESTQRLSTVSVWRATTLFSERERAALTWAEALTRVSEISPKERDLTFELVKGQFTEKELVDLTMAIIVINSWNRLHIAFGILPVATKKASEMKAAS